MPVNVSLMEDIPFFRNLNQKELEEISIIMKEVIFNKNNTIFAKGDKTKAFYIILEGEVMIKKTFDRKSPLVATLSKGALVGELAFLSDEIHSLGAKTCTRVRLLEIPIDKFKELLEEKKSFAAYKLVYKMAQTLSFRLARMGEQFVEFFESEKFQKEDTGSLMDYIKALLS